MIFLFPFGGICIHSLEGIVLPFFAFAKVLQKKTDACLVAVEKLKKEIMERLRQAEAVEGTGG